VLSGFFEFDGGLVAEGVEDAEHEVGGNVEGVAVHDGGDAGARCGGEAADLSVGQTFLGDDFDDFGVQFAAEADFCAVGRFEAQCFGKLLGGAGDDEFRFLHPGNVSDRGHRVKGRRTDRSKRDLSAARAHAFTRSERDAKDVGSLRSR
jgi:hypothetical protein